MCCQAESPLWAGDLAKDPMKYPVKCLKTIHPGEVFTLWLLLCWSRVTLWNISHLPSWCVWVSDVGVLHGCSREAGQKVRDMRYHRSYTSVCNSLARVCGWAWGRAYGAQEVSDIMTPNTVITKNDENPEGLGLKQIVFPAYSLLCLVWFYKYCSMIH